MIFVPFKFGKISHPNLISVRFHNLSRLLFFCSRNNRYKVGFTDGEERELEITAILSPSLPSVSSGTTCAKLTHRIQFVFCAYWKLKDNNRALNESLKRNESKYNLVYLPGRISSKKYLQRKQHWTSYKCSSRRSRMAEFICEFRLQHCVVRESNEPSLGEIY